MRRSFGNNAEVAGYGCRCPFVYIGSPQVEGNQRYLESHAGEEEYESHDLHRVAVDAGNDVVKVKCTYCSYIKEMPYSNNPLENRAVRMYLAPASAEW
jgi:diaminopimelate epimerase